MMKNLIIILLFSLLSNSVNAQNISEQIRRLKFSMLPETTFRFPCGDSIGNGYYIAQGFQDTINGYGDHLALDINGVGGGNTDLGDTIYSIGYGIVEQADAVDYLTIYYKYNGKIIKVLYYHCKETLVNNGDIIPKGFPIATIGNSDGVYLAHLHLEVMSDTSLMGNFYGDPKGFIDPIELLPFHEKKKKVIVQEKAKFDNSIL